MKMWLLLLGLAVTCAAAAGRPGNCAGRCGEVYTRGQRCTCDYNCLQHNECCTDYESSCTTAQSCLGRCGETFRRGQPCDCDPQCVGYHTCCRDYRLHCDAGTSHPRTSQRVTAASSGKRKSQRSDEDSDSESEERFSGASGLHSPLPARPAVSSNPLHHGVLPGFVPASPNSPAAASSLHRYPVSQGAAQYRPYQGLSSGAGSRPRPNTLQDVTQALGLSVVEGGAEAQVTGDVGLCSDSPINALTALSNGTVLIFQGELLWPVDPVTRSVGPPQRITDALGVPAPVATVFTRCNCHRNTYLIKGDQLWRFDENMVMEPGFPKPLTSEFPGVTGRISAALAVPATRSSLETVYFFNNGDDIQRFTFSPSSTPSCSARGVLKTRPADVLLSGEINIKLSLKGFPNPVTSALSMPSPQRRDRYHHYVFTGPLFFSVHIVDNWPAPTKPDPSSALVPMLSPDTTGANTAAQSVNPPHPPNSIRVWLRCP